MLIKSNKYLVFSYINLINFCLVWFLIQLDNYLKEKYLKNVDNIKNYINNNFCFPVFI